MKIGTDAVLLGSWAQPNGASRILDIGTGTGVLALMLAQKSRDDTKILGLELHKMAAKVAATNFRESPWTDQLACIQGSIQAYAKSASEKFDYIISNPPFFSGGVLSHDSDRNSVRHTVDLSHSDLLRAVHSLLSARGTYTLIIPFLEGLRFIQMAEQYGLFPCRKMEVHFTAQKPAERLLLELSRMQQNTIYTEQLILNEANRQKTEAHNALISPYLLYI